jgi:PAS domain S-box-containing protein
MAVSAATLTDLHAAGLLGLAQSDPRLAELLLDVAAQLRSPGVAMMDGLPDAVLRVNNRGQVLEYNQPTLNILKGKAARISALRDLLPGDVEGRLLAALHQAIATGLLQQIEFELQGAHFVQQFEGRVQGLDESQGLIVLRDITEQRWLQQARAFSGSYFQSLVQRLNTGILICMPTGEVIIANDALLRMLDQRDEDLLGEPYPALVERIAPDEDTKAALLHQYASAFHGEGLVPQVTLHVQRAAGAGSIWLLVNADMEHDLETRTRQLKFTFTDVTDFRNAEIALRESEEQYAALLDRVTDVIYHLDHNQEILFLNAAWPRLIGSSIEDSLGQPILNFIHPDDRSACVAAFQLVSGVDITTDVEVRLVRPGGGLCWVVLRNQQVIGADGSLVGNYGMMIDITDRKRSESARAALDAKARTIVLLTTLLTNLSHDLRTPLSIIGVANFKISRYWEKLDEFQRTDSLGRIDEQVNRINAFLEEYSDLARLDIDLADFKTSPLALNAHVQAMVQAMENKSSRHIWRFTSDATENFIQGNHHWLTTMIRHLLDNALQFSPEGGPITVGVHRQGDEVSLAITDAGIGIDATDLEHVFEPFYRADKARAVETGLAGLGLTFVQRITEAHRGAVEITSSPNIGTTVRVRFPWYATD